MKKNRARIDAGFVAAALLAMAGVGCTSYRLDNTLPLSAPTERTGLPRYAIAKATLTIAPEATDEGLIDYGVYDISSATLTAQLSAESVRARPDVFSAAPEAIPVEMAITRSSYEMLMGAGGCVSCLTLTIYPLRSASDTGYQVEVTLSDGESGRKISTPVSFVRKETSWMSILPFGWIPVPGGSGERVTGDDRAIELRRKQMLAATVEATAIALTRTEPSDWRAVPPPPAPAESAP